MKVGILIHLYYLDLWKEFSVKLKNLTQDFDLYITLCQEDGFVIDQILSEFPDANITLVPNKGLDVGPFLLEFQKLIEGRKSYDYIIKLHTKKSIHHGQLPEFGFNWRVTLVDSLIGSQEKLNNTLAKLQAEDYGMATATRYIYQELNVEWMSDLLVALDLEVDHNCRSFAAGTMFIVKYSILRDFLGQINLPQLYELTTAGYIRDGGIEHKLERIFGFIVQKAGYKILGIN